MEWTAEKKKDVYDARSAGERVVDIALRLGTTKNAVIGLINREGWEWGGAPTTLPQRMDALELGFAATLAEIDRDHPKQRRFTDV